MPSVGRRGLEDYIEQKEVEMVARNAVDLGIRSELVEPGSHIALIWENDEEFREGVGFLERGVVAGDHLVVFGYDEANRRVLEVLREAGVEVDSLQEAGRLDVLGAAATGDATLASIAGTFEDAIEKGAGMIRLLGNIGWEREGWPSERDLLEFESKVTEAARDLPCVVVCMYDLQRCSGGTLVKGCFQTHPLTFFGNLVRENPYHVTHAEFVSRLQSG